MSHCIDIFSNETRVFLFFVGESDSIKEQSVIMITQLWVMPTLDLQECCSYATTSVLFAHDYKPRNSKKLKPIIIIRFLLIKSILLILYLFLQFTMVDEATEVFLIWLWGSSGFFGFVTGVFYCHFTGVVYLIRIRGTILNLK